MKLKLYNMNRHDKKKLKSDKCLGECSGIARHRLNRIIFLHLVKCLGRDTCYRCLQPIENYTEISVDHKIPWLGEENASELFFDLDNIAFSHRKCNSKFFRRVRNDFNKYGFIGIQPSRNSKNGSWSVRIKEKSHGCYKTKEEAAMAYDKYALEYFGEDVHLNFPDKDYSNYIPKPISRWKTKYYGVNFDKWRQQWKAHVWYDKKDHYIGRYDTEIEAARHYNKYILDNNLKTPINEGI